MRTCYVLAVCYSLSAIALSAADTAGKAKEDTQTQVEIAAKPAAEHSVEVPPQTEDAAAAATSARAVAAKAPLTEDEIRDRLGKTVSVEWQDMPLQDVCREIANLAGVSVVLDPAADKALPITLALREARLANVLTWLTEITHLHYQIRDQAIFITPQTTGKRMLVIYPVSDLLRAPRDAHPPGEETVADGEERRAPTPEDLQELIKKFVAPGTWR